MEQLITVLHYEIWLVLGGLALIVVYKMLTGGINIQLPSRRNGRL